MGFFLIVNLVFAWRLFIGGDGISAYLELKRRHQGIERELAAVEEKSLEFSREIRRLKSDRSYVEDVVRKRMNYLKDKELLYVFSGGGLTQSPSKSGAGFHGHED